MSEAVIAALSEEQARAVTERIKRGLEHVWQLVQDVQVAYQGRAWIALGYPSWDAYCTGTEINSGLHIPSGERGAILQALREAGLSTRAIAAATGLSKGTIGRALSGAPNGAPEVITGTDGKSYKADRSPNPVEAAAEAIRERFDARLMRLGEIESADVEQLDLAEAQALLQELDAMPQAWDADRAALTELIAACDRRMKELETDAPSS